MIVGGVHAPAVTVTVRELTFCAQPVSRAQNIDDTVIGGVFTVDPLPIDPCVVSGAVPRNHVTVIGAVPLKPTVSCAVLPDGTVWSCG